MRTNIDIDDRLLDGAMKATGLPTKKATVEEGLRVLVRIKGQARALDEMKGLGWSGNLGHLREGRRIVARK